MNIGKKVVLYKEKLGFKNYKDFSKAVGCSDSWLLDLSKKESITFIDLNNVVKLCDYLNITIDQLIKDNNEKDVSEETKYLDDKNDISYKIKEIILLLENEDQKFNGVTMNNKTKQICRDALEIVNQLTKQYL